MSDGRTVAIILAAGAGRRFGTKTKPLLPLPGLSTDDGSTFIERHVRVLGSLGIEPVVIVPAADVSSYDFLRDLGAVIVGSPHPAVTTGSTGSVQVGLAALRARGDLGAYDVIVMDCDIVYERGLMALVAQQRGPSCIVVNLRILSDDEEVRVYGRDDSAILVGKGFSPVITADLACIGESVGVVRVAAADVALLAGLTTWLVGDPPDMPPYGFARRLSEHEEIWQYFCALGKLSVCRLPAGTAFAECDTAADYEHILTDVVPWIGRRETPVER